MSEPYNPYRGIISDNRLITFPGLVGQVALSLDSEDTGITCDHVGILLPRTDGAPSLEVSKSPEGIELNYQGTLQTFNEAARGWQWLADGDQSPLLLEGLPGAQFFRAVSTTASELPEPVEPLSFVELQITGEAIGGELVIEGVLSNSDSPADVLILLPWGADPVTAQFGYFRYQTTLPPFVSPGQITVGMIASDHEGRRAVYSGQHEVVLPTLP